MFSAVGGMAETVGGGIFSGVRTAVTGVVGAVTDTVMDVGTLIVGESDVDDSLVNAKTPEDRWFTPATGWPEAPTGVKKWKPPPSLVPNAEELPEHYADGDDIIGELRLEVLQCDQIPQMMQLGRADPYVMVVFEKHAARTPTISNDRSPEWSKDVPRAFKFPITCPYSVIFVAVMDDDTIKDDPIGRVMIELGTLRANTVYDCVFALQYGPFTKHSGKRGLVRLRYSITFKSGRSRILHYLSWPPPAFLVPIPEDRCRKVVSFAYRGRYPSHKFRYSLLNAHVSELTGYVESVKTSTIRFFFYEDPALNLFYLVVWQLLVTFPWLLLACLPLSLAGTLAAGYWHRARVPKPVLSRPKVVDLMRGLFLAKKEPALGPLPRPAPEEDEDSGSEGEDDDAEDKEQKAEKSDAAKAPPAEDAESSVVRRVSASLFGSRAPLDDELAEIYDEIEEECEDEHNQSTQRQGVRGGFGFHPLAKILGPVQLMLGRALVYIRCVKYVLAWNDRALTLLLLIGLLLMTALLALLGWLIGAVVAMIPWAEVFEWTFRLLGLAILGPHMYWMGQKFKEDQAKWRAECDEYAVATDEEAEKILAEHRKRILKERRLHWGLDAKEEESKDSTHDEISRYSADGSAKLMRMSSSYFELKTDKDTYTLLTQPNPLLAAGGLKFRCRPKPGRSTAYPSTPPAPSSTLHAASSTLEAASSTPQAASSTPEAASTPPDASNPDDAKSGSADASYNA